MITLNVGGKLFPTTMLTIEKIPSVKSLIESQMGKILDSNGNVFIDRDPVMFEKILNFVRNGEPVIVDDVGLALECKYYCVEFIYKQILTVREVNIEYSDGTKYVIPDDKMRKSLVNGYILNMDKVIPVFESQKCFQEILEIYDSRYLVTKSKKNGIQLFHVPIFHMKENDLFAVHARSKDKDLESAKKIYLEDMSKHKTFKQHIETCKKISEYFHHVILINPNDIEFINNRLKSFRIKVI